jgi:hypothetical protein
MSKINVARTADEVLTKFIEAEKIMPVWERVAIFSWSDMQLLKDEIITLRAQLKSS